MAYRGRAVTWSRPSVMIGILIIAHGTLGESLIHCASHVLNKRPPRLQQLGVTAQDDPLLLLPQARALVKELDDGGGVLILSDMYGGSPSNIAAKLLVPGRVEGVAGVNLPDADPRAHLPRPAARDAAHQGGERRLRRRPAHSAALASQCCNGKLRSSTSSGCTPGHPPSSRRSPGVRSRRLADPQRPARQREEHHGRHDARRGQRLHRS